MRDYRPALSTTAQSTFTWPAWPRVAYVDGAGHGCHASAAWAGWKATTGLCRRCADLSFR